MSGSYIYLWIYYALYVELELEDADRAREVYKKCIQTIPHKSFTFGKVGIPKKPSILCRSGFSTRSWKSAKTTSPRRGRCGFDA